METNTFIVKCPHCGNKKKVGYTCTYVHSERCILWSDGRIESDNWYVPADTQQCPKCGKFFTLPPRDTLRSKREECIDTGQLSYEVLKQAIVELAGDEEAEASARLEAWWAFNALYKDYISAPQEEQAFNRANMEWLVMYHTPRTTRFSRILFELNRLLGNREVCEKMIEPLTYEEYVRQRKLYYVDNKMRDYETNDELWMRHKYKKDMAQLEYALGQPLIPLEID